jgi:hypothetical protein
MLKKSPPIVKRLAKNSGLCRLFGPRFLGDIGSFGDFVQKSIPYESGDSLAKDKGKPNVSLATQNIGAIEKAGSQNVIVLTVRWFC